MGREVGVGFCAPLWAEQNKFSSVQHGTRSPEDCKRDDSGVFEPFGGEIGHNNTLVEAECIKRCRNCSRCRFVSWSSQEAGICAWYAHCDLSDLRQWWSSRLRTDSTWHTRQVRHRIPLPLPQRPSTEAGIHVAAHETTRRLAIATLSLGSADEGVKQACGLVGWCESARRLRRALTVTGGLPWSIRLLVIDGPISASDETVRSPTDMRDCPEAEVVAPDVRLMSLIRRCINREGRHKFFTGMPSGVMLKWAMLSWTEFDAVLLVDLDVDMMPLESHPAEVAARWAEALPFFLRRAHRVDGVKMSRAGIRVIGSADHSSPLNTGFLLLRPSRFIYRDGLRVLESCQLNATHGWSLAGRPRQVLSAAPQRFFSTEAGGSTARLPRAPPWGEKRVWFVPLNRTHGYKSNDWRFVAGAEDQGFFLYMLFVRHRLGVYAHPDGAVHRVHHFWGKVAGAKAWEGRPWTPNMSVSPRFPMNLFYTSRIEPMRTRERSPCRDQLEALRRASEAHPHARVSKFTPPSLPLW
jgi:hypothetical protein